MPPMKHIGPGDFTPDTLYYTAPDGSRWGPLACSDHQEFDLEGNPNPPGQVGFKRTHVPCLQTVAALIEHFNRVQDVAAVAALQQLQGEKS